MIISVNWLKKFTGVDLPINELAELIGTRLVEIEGVEDLGAKFKDVLIVKVVECAPVEDSDHLNVTKIDDGQVAVGVERDENGLVQVVCGAPNVYAGMLAAWLPPESIVPETFGDKEPFVLGARKLRGLMSNGMLASAKELALYDDHDGIIEVDKDAAPGTRFAEVYELDDYLLDIENKSLTHRPDAFGLIGFAREIAGIQGKAFQTPEWLQNLAPAVSADGSIEAPTVIIDDPILSDRFEAIVLSGANEKAQSPLELQTYLARSGVRPINAIVDVTNYLMLLTGQPLHAYDYDKFLAVSGGKAEVHVRSAKPGETLKLLNGKELELSEDDMVIAAGDTAVGLAGAVGGADTEVDETTTRILLECATFNLYKLRAIQMRHGIFTEAITRLTKGVPAPLGAPVLIEAARMMGEFAGVSISSDIGDAYPGQKDPIFVTLPVAAVNETLGTQFAAEDVKELLENVECKVSIEDLIVTVEVPYWRNDIHIAEDVIEEVGRLNGYDTINVTLPRRDFVAVRPDEFDIIRSRVRNTLVRAGANEVLTYSFIHGDTMRAVGQNVEEAYRLTNSISPELQYYRQSIVPSLLTHVHANGKAGYDHFALFEFNKFHTKKHDLTEEGVPKELDSLGFVVANTKSSKSAAFYDAKQYLEYIASSLGLEFSYAPLEEQSDYPVTQPFEPKRSARVSDAKTGERIGVIGEFKGSVRKSFKLPESTAGFEISPRALQKLVSTLEPDYQALSKYPGTERDVCFQVSLDVTYAALEAATSEALAGTDLTWKVEPLDIYQPDEGDVKNVTLRIKLGSESRTLTGQEVGEVMQNVIQSVTTVVNGRVI